ncbi:helix-turn-helix domain-containing protein [Nesterenkonia sandarakina]|uniref:Glycerol operon regulatory protein n=1 Tax=Nesterenkonia sandarakina TaxID=272918 RepID=A0A2T0YIH4_9MICC|nr:helix-turn-helix domain-containing protein [Nesterenkonia sandarakina]PRZ14937.1 IclR family acetate operon transcriptional repressor [Nesterenkonia sandarakina]
MDEQKEQAVDEGRTPEMRTPETQSPGTLSLEMAAPEIRSPGARRAPGVQSVDRALDILEVINAHGGQLSLSELAEETGLPAPTAHRLLRTMIAKGYVRQLANRSYGLGEKLILLGQAASARA